MSVLISFQSELMCGRRDNIPSQSLSGCSAGYTHICTFSWLFLSLQHNQCLEMNECPVKKAIFYHKIGENSIIFYNFIVLKLPNYELYTWQVIFIP